MQRPPEEAQYEKIFTSRIDNIVRVNSQYSVVRKLRMLLLMFFIHKTSQSLSFSNAKLLTEMESLAVVQGV